MAKKPLRIGLVGYGFMGRTHSNGYKRVPDFFPELEYQPVLKAVCGRSEDKTKAFAEQWGYESYETDWNKLIARDDIDAIDICTPNDTHGPISIAAAKAGKYRPDQEPAAAAPARHHQAGRHHGGAGRLRGRVGRDQGRGTVHVGRRPQFRQLGARGGRGG